MDDKARSDVGSVSGASGLSARTNPIGSLNVLPFMLYASSLNK